MSRLLSGRRYRRLIAAVLGAALAGSMLSAARATASGHPAAPAQGHPTAPVKPGAHGLVRIVSPANGTILSKPRTNVVIKLSAKAVRSSLRVKLDRKNVTALFHLRGRTARGVLTAKSGLVAGANLIVASATGRKGGSSSDTVVVTGRGAAYSADVRPPDPGGDQSAGRARGSFGGDAER
jgi:hypothetical protein